MRQANTAARAECLDFQSGSVCLKAGERGAVCLLTKNKKRMGRIPRAHMPDYRTFTHTPGVLTASTPAPRASIIAIVSSCGIFTSAVRKKRTSSRMKPPK